MPEHDQCLLLLRRHHQHHHFGTLSLSMLLCTKRCWRTIKKRERCVCCHMSTNVCVRARTCSENIHDTRIVCHQLTTICVRLCVFLVFHLPDVPDVCYSTRIRLSQGEREKTNTQSEDETHTCLTTLKDNKFSAF